MEYSIQQLKKVYLIMASKVLVLLLACVIIIYITHREIKQEVNSLREERTLSAIMETREENVNKLKESYQKVESDIPNIREVVPASGAKLFEVINILKSLGEMNTKQVTITFSENSKMSELYDEITFNIYAQGTVEDLTKYIKLLEALPYGLKFVSYDISGQGGMANNNELRLQAKMMFRKK